MREAVSPKWLEVFKLDQQGHSTSNLFCVFILHVKVKTELIMILTIHAAQIFAMNYHWRVSRNQNCNNENLNSFHNEQMNFMSGGQTCVTSLLTCNFVSKAFILANVVINYCLRIWVNSVRYE